MNKENERSFFEHCLLESKTIFNALSEYVKSADYVYTDSCLGYLKQFNSIITKYSTYVKIPINLFKFENSELSDSKKTIRDIGYKRFLIYIKTFIEFLEKSISDINNTEMLNKIEFNQMRKCLKTGVDGCPKNPKVKKNQIFVGMPYNEKYEDAFIYAIKLVFEQNGYTVYRADYSQGTIDVMCKICNELQSSDILIFNISDSNPNVMLEVGLSYGLGKKIILLKDKETKTISDLSGIEYIEYANAGNLQQKLIRYIDSI